jgi:hypothetical protein
LKQKTVETENRKSRNQKIARSLRPDSEAYREKQEQKKGKEKIGKEKIGKEKIGNKMLNEVNIILHLK